jgi:hypothetical protein
MYFSSRAIRQRVTGHTALPFNNPMVQHWQRIRQRQEMYSFQNGETDRIAGAVLLQNPPVELMCKLCSELSQNSLKKCSADLTLFCMMRQIFADVFKLCFETVCHRYSLYVAAHQLEAYAGIRRQRWRAMVTVKN